MKTYIEYEWFLRDVGGPDDGWRYSVELRKDNMQEGGTVLDSEYLETGDCFEHYHDAMEYFYTKGLQLQKRFKRLNWTNEVEFDGQPRRLSSH